MVQQPSADEMAIPGRVYVAFTDDNLRITADKTGLSAFDLIASPYQVTAIEKAFPSLDVIARRRPLAPSTETLRRVYVVRYNASDLPRNVAEDLETVAGVRYAEPVFASTPSVPVPEKSQAIPYDVYYSDQVHLPFLNLEVAWDVVKGEDGTAVIAIVDGGTYWQHEDLRANVWTNADEVDGDGVDNDNNGYVDDIHGWNFLNGSPDPNGPRGSSNNAHGTMVAGAAAAVTDNSIGIAGASWNAQFMGLNTSCRSQGRFCFTRPAVLYASLNGADVINASYGQYAYSETDRQVYQAATEEGSLIVAAAGNDGTDNDVTPHYPSSYPVVLSVGATQKNTNTSIFNYGKTVNVFAPGRNIEGTYPKNSLGLDQYSRASGTSLAAPLVSGVAALVKTAFPSFDAHQLREQIRLTAVSIDNANSPLGKFGSGKVDAFAAVTTQPLPGLRVVNWFYQAQNGTSRIGLLDTVEVQVAFTNYHGAGTGLTAELIADAPFLKWLTPEVSLGDMNSGDTKQATFHFSFTSGAPAKGTVWLSPTIKASEFEDSADLFFLSFNQAYDETIALVVSPESVPEGGGSTTITVTAISSGSLSYAPLLPITVTGSGTEGATDFIAVADFNLTLPANEQEITGTFTLTPIDDLVDETTETITIRSTNALVTQPATLTLTDDDAAPTGFTLSVHPTSVDEGDGNTTITLTGTVTGGTTYHAAQLLDIKVEGSGNTGVVGFTPVTGVALFIAPETLQNSITFTLSPVDNTDQDADETITISSTSPLVSDSATITLTDNDGIPITLSVSPASVSEGDGSITITVTATSTTVFTDSQVLPLTVTGSGITTAVDFSPVSGFDLTLPVNTTTVNGSFILTPADDPVDEIDEILSVSSSSVLVGNAVTVTLQDDDVAPEGIVLSVNPDDIREDDGATTITVTATVDGDTRYADEKVLNVTLTGTGVAGAVDYTTIQEFWMTVSAEAASGIAGIILTPENDEEGEADETITVSSDSSFVLSDAMLVIRDDDGGRTSRDLETETVAFGVAPPYPNPASGTLTFVLSSPEPADWARLLLYNMLGQEVAVPYEGTLRAGLHTVHYDGQHLPAGVYMYILEARDTRVSGQLIMAQ